MQYTIQVTTLKQTAAWKIDYAAVLMVTTVYGGQLQLIVCSVWQKSLATGLPQTAAAVLTCYRGAAAVAG